MVDWDEWSARAHQWKATELYVKDHDGTAHNQFSDWTLEELDHIINWWKEGDGPAGHEEDIHHWEEGKSFDFSNFLQIPGRSSKSLKLL